MLTILRRAALAAVCAAALPCATAARADDAKRDAPAAAQAAELEQNCGHLTGRSLAYVCDRITSAPLTTQCFQAARGLPTDMCALAACDRITSAEITVNCVRAVAGRGYQLDEVLACDRITDANETVSCLGAAGRWIGGGGGGDTRQIRLRIADALDFLRQQRYARAEAELQALLEDLERLER